MSKKSHFVTAPFFRCARYGRALMNESFWTARWQHIGSPLLMLIEEDRVPRGIRFFSSHYCILKWLVRLM